MLEKLQQIAARYGEVEALLQDPEVFKDAARAQALLREQGRLKGTVFAYRRYLGLLERKAEAEAVLAEGDDAELAELARGELADLERGERETMDELRRLLVDDDPNAGRDVIVEIRAGVGGDEASLFAADLFRMYSRWAERKKFRVELLSATPSDVRGYKEVIFSVAGDGAYDRLKHESGGHRVQRVPDTESQGRIHTSLATVAVLPEAESVEVDIKDEDIKFDTFRAGGPGGQNVNKTSSAVRLTHLPTGLVVTCQDESSQHKNRAKAMRVLRARLFEMEESRRRAERDRTRRSQIGSGDRGERIRTYNFPQGRVTDHRLKENFNVDRIIDGDLDALLDELKRLDIEEKLKTLI
jgi:peptide chain release factor 1